ncbi:MAG: polyphosphate polymerase domain-containing protein [Oscillospiraceae bacterium]|nr:polyphosphate polymerase domain-containing protein [Oscillospiraceae bacterium]
MGYIQSFNRRETKYLLTAEQAEAFLREASDLISRDKYGEYTICNLYLDTDDFYFIEHSLDHPAYKEKLRIRSYGNADREKKIFFEIKKKSKGVVYKRRIIIPFAEAEDYVEKGVRPQSLEGFVPNQIFEEIDYLMKKYKPEPKLYLAYDREAYFMTEHPEVRITFDKNIRGRWKNITLTSDEDAELLDTGTPNYRVMEIKSGRAIPLEITEILSRLKIYPVSFSKYGKIYTAKIQKNKTSNRKEVTI